MILSHMVRDNSGAIHQRGEQVTVVRQQIRLGIHDMILVCQWPDGTRVVLLPSDVEQEPSN